MGRPPCCDKSNVKRGLWTPEEDAKILAYVSNHGIGNWTLVPKKAGLNRCGKSCRLRWTNYLRPDLKHDSFTPQEEEMIINLHEAIGSRWSLIAKRLPGRTDNDVKNHWNTKLRKKLMKMGIDPVTHKPVSQVLSDLGSISGLPTTGNQMLPLRTEPCAAQYSSGPASGSGGTKRKLMVEQAQDDEGHQREHQVQFQVINPAANVSNEAASSCSSSCSSNLTRLSSPQSQNTHPCSSFDWSEFLLSDPFMCAEFQQLQQYEMQGVLSSLSPSVQMQNEIQLSNNTKGNKQGAASEDSMVVNAYEASMEYQINKQYEGSSSSGNSFVDDILDRDSEIRAAIPDLLDASFDY